MAKTAAPSGGALAEQTVHRSELLKGEKMAAPSITLFPEKKSPTNGHGSPGRAGKTIIPAPSHTEKKPHVNGQASPSHLAANHAAKQLVDGYMKTDDRMRLAKERREEKERSLAAREQLMREKDRRARLQYERTVEERWRRLEEQRQKEEQRRAAVEEKRRQQLEEERERLDALMKRSLERSLLLEQRGKRWSRGCTNGAAPCSPHRSPFGTTLTSADHSRPGLQGGSQSTPNTPKKQRLRRERRTASPGYGSPVRRPESPACVSKQLASPTTSKLTSKVRPQSPNAAHQNFSPTRPRPNEKMERHVEEPAAETGLKKSSNTSSTTPTTPQAGGETPKVKPSSERHLREDTHTKNQSPDRKDQTVPRADSSEKKTPNNNNAPDGDGKTESATQAARAAAGTTSAEEATRLLAERRRQARAQKELEEKKQEQEKEERLKEEQLRNQTLKEKRQPDVKHQPVEEKKKKNEGEDLHRLQQQKEEKEKEKEKEKEVFHTQMDKEKDKSKVQPQEDTERQRQDRDMQTQQEEERQLRKKRIEEIMKRTRKVEADLKKEEEALTRSVSPPGVVKTVQSSTQVIQQTCKKVEFQVKEVVTVVQASTKDRGPVSREAVSAKGAQQMESHKSVHVRSSTHHQVTSADHVAEKRPDSKGTSKELVGPGGKTCAVEHRRKEVANNVNQQHTDHKKTTVQMNKETTNVKAEAKAKPQQGGVMNGAVEGKGSSLMSGRATAEKNKHQSSHLSAAAGSHKGGSQVEAIRPSVPPLLVRHLSPPVIKLEPLDVKGTGSCNEVQAMEISPSSKEELISIPRFSPVNEIQPGGLSNARALEDLMDLTGSVTYQRTSSEINLGDCNKNLIEGVVSPVTDSKLLGVSPSSSNKLNIK
ncbi:MAP7 domain-containing protein 2a isoform X6 [Cynoglossus semilaevis]|uniref:MAP7 domain-containing protein 2a isoform X6 n=1 Tax=Cynoglossus semilaevis TaxID=244447 RepID=UPI0007DCA126|nr:MAP7 domain-containing protein 2-like isoform X6 [Cynoglossus semilaevis]